MLQWAAWTGVIAGLWSIVAPFAAGYYNVNAVATTEAVVVGLLIAGFSLWLALANQAPRYLDYLIGLFGVWSVIAPFALDYRNLTAAFYNDVMVGVVVFFAAIGSIYARWQSGARSMRPKTA